MKQAARFLICFALITLLAVSTAVTQTLTRITLPAPETEIGMPLMQALTLRQSIREYSDRKLPPRELSNLLWAAWGINRPDGRHTAPTSSNRQEFDLYVVLEGGTYRYNPSANTLEPVVAGDLRAATGRNDWVATAPLNLLFIADLTKREGTRGSETRQGTLLTVAADAGFISQNVYVYCASQGLATVVRAGIDRDACARALNLDPERYYIAFAQTVGYPR